MGFPFLFHGARPDDWTTDHHPYRLIFAGVPLSEERRRLAIVLEDFIAHYPHLRMGAWTWNGRQTRFILDKPAEMEEDTWFIDVELLVRTIHRQVRLAEVVHESALGGSTEWDAWTSTRQSRPTGFASGEWTEDAGFEALRMQRRPLAVDAAKAEAQRKEQARIEQEHARSSAMRLEAIPCAAPMEESQDNKPPPALAALFEAAGPPKSYVCAGERWFGLVEQAVLYVDHKGKVKKRALKLKYKQACFSPDGSIGIFSGFRSVQVRFPEGEVSDSVLRDVVGFASADRVVCVGFKHVTLWSLKVEIDGKLCGASEGWWVNDMVAAKVSDDSGGHVRFAVQFYRANNDRLQLVGEVPDLYPTRVWATQGRIFAEDLQKRTLEIVGWIS